jgi:hypothetical protein
MTRRRLREAWLMTYQTEISDYYYVDIQNSVSYTQAVEMSHQDRNRQRMMMDEYCMPSLHE